MDLITYLLEKVEKRQGEISETLMSNGVGDMNQYHHFMGQVTALGYLEQTLKETRKRMENADDD